MPQGSYYVQFELPSAYKATAAEQGGNEGSDSNGTDETGMTRVIAIGDDAKYGWVDPTIDLGIVPKGAIGNYVWLDSNRDGKQNEVASRGMNGVVVKLYDENHTLLAETSTRDDGSGNPGYYLFEHLLEGVYYVGFEIPRGYRATKAEAAGATAADDSNALTDQGITEAIAIGESSRWQDLTIDLGLLRLNRGGAGFIPIPEEEPEESGEPSDPERPQQPGEPGGPDRPEGPIAPPVVPGEPEQPVEPGGPDESGGPAIPNEALKIVDATSEAMPVSGQVDLPPNGKPSIGKTPDNGAVAISPDGKWTYTPNPGFVGKDTFGIVVTDENGNQQEILFEIDVEEVPLGTVGAVDAPGRPGDGALPKTGEGSYLLLQLAGLVLIAAGAAALVRARRRRAKP